MVKSSLRRWSLVAGPNWTALEGRLSARYQQGAPVLISPQARSFWAPPQQTSESALLTRWNGQLYAVLGDETEDGRWQLRLWWKPFVTCIWYGGLLIALGGLLALIGRVSTDLRRRSAQAQIERRKEKLRKCGKPDAGKWVIWLPLTLFVGFLALVAFQLFQACPREVESAMIGKPVPQFALRPAMANIPGLSTADMQDGKPKLLNVWASWCIPARRSPTVGCIAQAGRGYRGCRYSRQASKDVGRFLRAIWKPL